MRLSVVKIVVSLHWFQILTWVPDVFFRVRRDASGRDIFGRWPKLRSGLPKHDASGLHIFGRWPKLRSGLPKPETAHEDPPSTWGLVVPRPISANPGLNFSLAFFFCLCKCFYRSSSVLVTQWIFLLLLGQDLSVEQRTHLLMFLVRHIVHIFKAF